MEQQLYREVNDGVGTKLIEVSEEKKSKLLKKSMLRQVNVIVFTFMMNLVTVVGI